MGTTQSRDTLKTCIKIVFLTIKLDSCRSWDHTFEMEFFSDHLSRCCGAKLEVNCNDLSSKIHTSGYCKFERNWSILKIIVIYIVNNFEEKACFNEIVIVIRKRTFCGRPCWIRWMATFAPLSPPFIRHIRLLSRLMRVRSHPEWKERRSLSYDRY